MLAFTLLAPKSDFIDIQLHWRDLADSWRFVEKRGLNNERAAAPVVKRSLRLLTGSDPMRYGVTLNRGQRDFGT